MTATTTGELQCQEPVAATCQDGEREAAQEADSCRPVLHHQHLAGLPDGDGDEEGEGGQACSEGGRGHLP